MRSWKQKDLLYFALNLKQSKSIRIHICIESALLHLFQMSSFLLNENSRLKSHMCSFVQEETRYRDLSER